MHLEIAQRTLRQVREARHQAAGPRVGDGRAGELYVGSEAVGGEDQAVAIAGLRLAEVDVTRNRAGQRRALQGEGAHL